MMKTRATLVCSVMREPTSKENLLTMIDLARGKLLVTRDKGDVYQFDDGSCIILKPRTFSHIVAKLSSDWYVVESPLCPLFWRQMDIPTPPLIHPADSKITKALKDNQP